MIEFKKGGQYNLIFIREGKELIFTAKEIQVIGELISFTDKYNKQIIFPTTSLSQAKEL